ncbi:MAG: hypothetical protein GWP08_08795 [Nitrospiraceae bacterium]|nr:hypothetical protein [Nitrospiraceae bacterium]
MSPGDGTHAPDSVVTLEAHPGPGFLFDHWEGDFSGSDNPAELLMDSSKVVTAVFVEAYSIISDVFPVGSGAVDPSRGTFKAGSVLDITAYPEPNYVFDRWAGDLWGSENPKSVTMSRDKIFTAIFKLIKFELTTSVHPPGTGTVDPAGGLFGAGGALTIIARAADTYVFDHWEGDLTGFQMPAELLMDSNKGVVAVFAKEMFHVSTAVVPEGGGTIAPNPGDYPSGEIISALATASEGFVFDRWEGDLSGTANPAEVTVDSDKSLVAVFEQVTRELTTSTQPPGVGAVTPREGTYAQGEVVALAAEGVTGYVFDHWEGDLDGEVNPTSVIMDVDKHVTAFFAPECALQSAHIAWPMDGERVLIDDGAEGLGLVLSVDTNCPSGTSAVIFSLDGAEPVWVRESDPPGHYTTVSPPVSELGFGRHTLDVAAVSVADLGVLFTDSVSFHVESAGPGADADLNGLPDHPFETLGTGDRTWFSTLRSLETGAQFVAAAARWGGAAVKQGGAPPALSVVTPGVPASIVTVAPSAGLLEPGESAVLMVLAGPDTDTVYGAAMAGQFAPSPSSLLVDGGRHVEISILVSDDGGQTCAEIDPARLAAHPVHLTMEGLEFVPGGVPLLYAHPTQVLEHPEDGMQIAVTPGAWSTVSATVGGGSIEADLTSLSSFAPFEGPAIQVTPSVDDPALFDFIFGFVPVGQSKTATFTISNPGGQTLIGQAATVSPFAIGGTSSYVLAPGALLDVNVVYTASAKRAEEGTVEFSGSAGAVLRVVGSGYEANTPGCAGGAAGRSAWGDLVLLVLVQMVLLLGGGLPALKRAKR